MNARDHELFDAYCIAVVRGNSVDAKRLAAELEGREKARRDKNRVRPAVDIRVVRSDVAERMTEMWKSHGRLDVKEYLRLREKLLETVVEAEAEAEEEPMAATDKTTQHDEDTPPLPAKKKTAQVKVINLTPQSDHDSNQ